MSRRRPWRAMSGVLLTLLTVGAASRGEGPAVPRTIRGILIEEGWATPDRLEDWKAKGVNAAIVPLDESTSRARWAELAALVEGRGLALYAWVEVARNPALAEAHPGWMAAPGGHHDDWR